MSEPQSHGAFSSYRDWPLFTLAYLSIQWARLKKAITVISREFRFNDLAKEIDPSWNALHYATYDENYEVVCSLAPSSLLEGRTSLGWTPLHIAALRSNDLDIVRVLLRHGAVVKVQDNFGRTPLHFAITGGLWKSDTHKLTSFLKYWQSADFRARESVAVRGMSEAGLSIAQMLLNMGADMNARNEAAMTPFDLVYHMDYEGDKFRLALLLGEHLISGATHTEWPKIESVSYAAMQRRSLGYLWLLLELKGDPNEVAEGETAIQWACSHGDFYMAQLLDEYAYSNPFINDASPSHPLYKVTLEKMASSGVSLSKRDADGAIVENGHDSRYIWQKKQPLQKETLKTAREYAKRTGLNVVHHKLHYRLEEWDKADMARLDAQLKQQKEENKRRDAILSAKDRKADKIYMERVVAQFAVDRWVQERTAKTYDAYSKTWVNASGTSAPSSQSPPFPGVSGDRTAYHSSGGGAYRSSHTGGSSTYAHTSSQHKCEQAPRTPSAYLESAYDRQDRLKWEMVQSKAEKQAEKERKRQEWLRERREDQAEIHYRTIGGYGGSDGNCDGDGD